MLEKNQLAPDFTAPDQNNKVINLSEYRDNKNVVLYFYPKDDTTGCTLEARQFTEFADRFSELETVIIGVSWYSINLIMTDAASLWCFATRHSTQAMAIVLVKCCNAVARHHSGARRVGLSLSG